MTFPQYPQQPGYPVHPQQPGYPHAPAYPQYQYGTPYAVQPPPRPPNHLGLAIVGLLFFWPVGLQAVLYASKVDVLYMSGNWDRAYLVAYRAQRCGIWAIALGAGLGFVYLLLRIALGTS